MLGEMYEIVMDTVLLPLPPLGRFKQARPR
jgi:hypothetical protein